MSSSVNIDIEGLNIAIKAAPLNGSAFAPFGQVIQNPRPDLDIKDAHQRQLPLNPGAVFANQGSAIKYQNLSCMTSYYDQAPSRRPGVAVMNLFVCGARDLETVNGRADCRAYNVNVLERHPFTSQTFIPLTAQPQQHYLVIVAPSLPVTQGDAAMPVPSSPLLPGRGLPDLNRLRAFVASTDQAVTYAPGTWHAPMVAMGAQGSCVNFVVVQFTNQVATEDCQEVFLSSRTPSSGLVAAIVPFLPASAKL